MDLNVRWSPARVDDGEITRLAGAMPGPVAVLSRKDARVVTLEVIGGVVDAIALEAGEKLERPATPPVIRNAADVGEAFVARLDGSPVHGADPGRRRGVEAPRPVGPPGERRGQDHPRRAARPARPRRRLVPVGARAGRGGRPAPDRAGPHRQQAHPAPGRRDRPARAPLRQARPGRRSAPRPGVPEPGRGVGADDRHRSVARVGRVRGAGAGALPPQALAGAPPVRRAHRARRWWAPTSSATCAGPRCSTTSSSPPPTSPGWPRRPGRSCRSHGKWVELDRVDLKEAAAALAERGDAKQLTGAEILRHVVGLEGTPFGAGVTVEGSGWVTDLLEKASAAPAAPVTKPEGFVGELRSLPGGGARLARLPRRRGARRLPRPRHGPRQDAHRARPPRPHAGQRAVPRDRPAGGGRQLGGRGAALHARPAGGRPPRRVPRVGRGARGRGGRRRRGHHHLRHRGARRRRPRAARVGSHRPRRGPGHQEPHQRDVAGAPPHRRPHPARPHGHADRERARRPVVDPRLHQPRPGRPPPHLHRPAVRRGRAGPAGAQRDPRVPPHQDRAEPWPPSCPTASTSSTTAR